MAIRGHKSTCWGRLCPPEVKLVLVYEPKWQQMATVITIACWSAVWQLGPAEFGTAIKGPQGSKLLLDGSWVW
jgi:hypothetical protein